MRLAPDNPDAHYNLGLALKENHHAEAALEEFETTLRLKRGYAEARYDRAVLLRQKGDKELANREFDQLAGLSQFRNDLSQAKLLTTTSSSGHLKKHEPDAALADARAALELWKDNPAAYYLMGVAWGQKDDTAQARQDFEKALALQPDYPPALNSLGLILWQEGSGDRAIEEWDKAIAFAPDCAEAHYNRGVAGLRVGDVQRGVQELREAVALEPDYLDARLNLGLALQQRGDAAAAMQRKRSYSRCSFESDTPGCGCSRVRLSWRNSQGGAINGLLAQFPSEPLPAIREALQPVDHRTFSPEQPSIAPLAKGIGCATVTVR